MHIYIHVHVYVTHTCVCMYNLDNFTASTLVYLSALLVWSGLAAVGQVLFQIVLLTDYSDQLQPCKLTKP